MDDTYAKAVAVLENALERVTMEASSAGLTDEEIAGELRRYADVVEAGE